MLWQWSLALGKKNNVEEAISRPLKALKIYADIAPSEASKINAQIEEWVDIWLIQDCSCFFSKGNSITSLWCT